eukprot:1165090-Pleurochrysis_carterae.AAC.1
MDHRRTAVQWPLPTSRHLSTERAAPGERTLRPRLIPTHARASIVFLEYATRCLTAYARQPNGSMLMMRGLVPVSSSYEEASVLGGPLVRFRISSAWVTA